jgi:hypothetical protein
VRRAGQAFGRAVIYAVDRSDLDAMENGVAHGVVAVAELEGDPDSAVHLPAAYLDEILLRDRRRDAEDRLYAMRQWAEVIRLATGLPSSRFAERPQALAGPERELRELERATYRRLGVPHPDDADYPYPRPGEPEYLLGPVDLVSQPDGEPYAVIETRMTDDFRASTACRPRRRLGHVLQAGFWAYWNSIVTLMSLEPVAVRSLVENLTHQFDFYDARGLSMRHAGEAVRYGMLKGAGARAQP